MSEPRRHHFVPQVYLKSFSTKEEKGNKIYVFDKIQGISYKTDVSKIAVERDFYRIPNKQNEYEWEIYYSRDVEPIYPPVIDKLKVLCAMSRDNSIILDTKLKDSLVKIVYSQLLRTKKARINFEKLGEKAATQRLEELKIELGNLHPELREWLTNYTIDDTFVREHTLKAINDDSRFQNIGLYLKNRYWMIYNIRSERTTPLITSDHPVALYNFHRNSTDFSDNGLGLNTSLIIFPITSKILIALYPRLYFGGLNNYDGRLIVTDEQKFISTINQIQYSQSYRQVYSSESFENMD